MALYFLMLGLNPRLSLSLLPWSDFFLLLFFCYISSSIDPIRKHGRTRIRWAAPTRGQRRVRQGFCAYLFLLSAQTGEEREKKKACVWDSLLTIVLSLTISSFYYHIFFFSSILARMSEMGVTWRNQCCPSFYNWTDTHGKHLIDKCNKKNQVSFKCFRFYRNARI